MITQLKKTHLKTPDDDNLGCKLRASVGALDFSKLLEITGENLSQIELSYVDTSRYLAAVAVEVDTQSRYSCDDGHVSSLFKLSVGADRLSVSSIGQGNRVFQLGLICIRLFNRG